MIKIILADDDPIILSGLSMIIESNDEIELLGTAANGDDAVKLCRETKPDVAVLDIRMPILDGIEASKIIIDECSSAPLLLTTFDEPELIDKALDTGVKGFILKSSTVEGIVSAIKTVSQGGTVFAQDVVDYLRLNKKANNTAFFSGLSEREREIVELIASGLSNKEISQKLFLSNGTVRNYISLILEKTGLEHRTQIAVKYYIGT